jgi:HEAT repeat protein
MAEAEKRGRTAAIVPTVRPAILRKVLVADTATLTGYLASKETSLTREAVTEAGGRKNPAFVPALTAVAIAPGGHASLGAVYALAGIPGSSARAALRKIAKQPNQPARLHAALNLAEKGEPSGKPALLEGLRIKRVLAVDTGSMSASKLAAARYSEYFRDKYRIAHALIGLGYGHTKPELYDLLKGSADDRRRILPELAAKPWPHVKPALIRILGDQREYHGNRKWAAIALGKSHYRPAVDALMAALKDPVKAVRDAAIAALVEIGDRRAIKGLEVMARSEQLAMGAARGLYGRPQPLTAREAVDILRRKGN